MAARLADRIWTLEEMVRLVEFAARRLLSRERGSRGARTSKYSTITRMRRRVIQIGSVLVVIIAFIATAASIWRGVTIKCGGTQFSLAGGRFCIYIHQLPKEWQITRVGINFTADYLFTKPYAGGYEFGYAVFIPWWIIDLFVVIGAVAILWKTRKRTDCGFPVATVSDEP
jgi:hypothetical protein